MRETTHRYAATDGDFTDTETMAKTLDIPNKNELEHT